MHIGLLMSCNEADVIEEYLLHVQDFVDAIFVLDGSDDGTDKFLQAHPKVLRIFKDAEVSQTSVKDFHRHVLLDAARAQFGQGHWYTLLHPDEFFYDDPEEIILRAEKEKAVFVNWMSMQFFLHCSDEQRPTAATHVQERIHWYSPFWIEVRQFKDNPKARYRTGEHGRVFPRGVGWKPFSRMPILKHYPFRSVEQTQRKWLQPGLSATPNGLTIYQNTAQAIYKTAREFKGDFEEFEMKKQRNLLHTFLWQRKLIK